MDGSRLPAGPKRVEALWPDEPHRAFKVHTPFEWLRSVPVRMDRTAGNADEREVLEEPLQSGRIDGMDRG